MEELSNDHEKSVITLTNFFIVVGVVRYIIINVRLLLLI